MVDSTLALEQLRSARAEYQHGVQAIGKRLEQVQKFGHLAKTTTRFLHEVDSGLIRNSDMRLDMETIALCNDTKAREFELRAQVQSSDGDTKARAELQLKNILPAEKQEEYTQM